MGVEFSNKLSSQYDGKILRMGLGDALTLSSDDNSHIANDIDLKDLEWIIDHEIYTPIHRIAVLNRDETLNYIIPNEDIALDGINYSCNYTNGQRRSLSLKLINIPQTEIKKIKKRDLNNKYLAYYKLTEKPDNWDDQYTKYYFKLGQEYIKNYKSRYESDIFYQIAPYDPELSSNISDFVTEDVSSLIYPYTPNVNKLWYGTKISYDMGIEYQGKEYYFKSGIYIIKGFDFNYSSSDNIITYTLVDKFGQFDGAQGTLDEGFEIPVGTEAYQAIQDLLNLSNATGYILDTKKCILDTKWSQFKTQSTIRIENSGTMAELIQEIATQMSAEYYYNSSGYLVFYPLDESMNDIKKSIIWSLNEIQLNQLNFKSEDDIVNVIKVLGTNIDSSTYSYVAKNTNLDSPINIYRIGERRDRPIESAQVWSDDMAKDLAEYQLRQKSIIVMKQSIQVPYNPLLMVNNIIEINNEALGLVRSFYLINGISYTSGSSTMTLEVANLNNLPLIGGIPQHAR